MAEQKAEQMAVLMDYKLVDVTVELLDAWMDDLMVALMA